MATQTKSSIQEFSHLRIVSKKVNNLKNKIVKKNVVINSLTPNFTYINHLGKEVTPQQMCIY